MEVDYGHSQDVLATLKHSVIGFPPNREPWSRSFKCDAVNFEPVLESSIRASTSSAGSRGLPSLREEYADFAELGSSLFCTASLETRNGVDFLFGHLFKVLRRLQSSPTTSNMKEFIEVLGLLEFVGMGEDVDDAAIATFNMSYCRFLLKIGPLYNSAVAVPMNGCSQNISFHAALFAWHVACKLLNKKPQPSPQNGILSGEEALVLMLDGLAALRRSCGSSIPCSCVQSVLVDLYDLHSNKILELCLCVMRHLTSNESLFSLNQSHKFGTVKTSAAEFFEFFAETISHFIDIRLMPLEQNMSRFVLLVGVGELLCDKEPIPTFKVLHLFMKKYRMSGLAKIRKSASKFVAKILQSFECIEIPELEKLSRGDPLRWAESVKSLFACLVAEELFLIQFLVQLLSDEQLSSCCGIIANRYSSTTFLSNDCVLSSVLSLLLAVISGTKGERMLAAKLCEWITGSVEGADDLHCKVLFNALDVLGEITSEAGTKNSNVPVAMVNCLNALPLPERNAVFGRRCAAMARTYPKEFASVDIDRFVSSTSRRDLLAFLNLFSDVEVEISGSIWDKAATLLATSMASDVNLRAFVINQLAIGMRCRSPQSLSRFKSCIEKLSCAQPDPEFLFAFCNGVLSRLEGQHLPFISQLLPLWIYAVLAYSRSRELDTKAFTSMIWDHISRMLVTVDAQATVELSPGNSEAFLMRFITVLGDSATSDVVRKIVADAVTFQLGNQIVTLLKSDNEDMQERVVRICCEILHKVGPTLLAVAEEEAPRIGLNRTAFVVITQAVVSKMVKNSFNHDFLLQVVPTCISALARLPYRMFIYSRIKDLLFKFGTESAFSCRILEELSSSECSAHYNQLNKDTDARIRRIFENSMTR
ncbi:hypothetical protein Y032_0257g396 [Ancylostoma ceylanicum]|uniref:Uncharacterized protein n=1 Tax=Ancylostoma ceylanicum TaxID=53326 RepID=A0A016SBV2_9BILA|nr:hypothetical protein Y032_0257g396 [Ancylostoma ceylanicum]